MLKANVKLSYDPSPSTDVAKAIVNLNIGGLESTIEVAGTVSEVMVVIAASTSCHWSVTTFDTDGNQVESVVDSFTVGDLTAPLPATNLRHEIVSVFDDADVPAPANPTE